MYGVSVGFQQVLLRLVNRFLTGFQQVLLHLVNKFSVLPCQPSDRNRSTEDFHVSVSRVHCCPRDCGRLLQFSSAGQKYSAEVSQATMHEGGLCMRLYVFSCTYMLYYQHNLRCPAEMFSFFLTRRIN